MLFPRAPCITQTIQSMNINTVFIFTRWKMFLQPHQDQRGRHFTGRLTQRAVYKDQFLSVQCKIVLKWMTVQIQL